MKLVKWLPLILFFSCIDIFIQTTPYNSLYFTGGSWIEFPKIDDMKMDSTANDFTLQFWVSGGEWDVNEAPALFSIVDPVNMIKLALFRDMGNNNIITIQVNNCGFQTDTIAALDWSDPDNFNLISFIFSDTELLKVYVNEVYINQDSQCPENNADSIDVSNASLMFGVVANREYRVLENFWYGHVDEMRLWNTRLADSTIQFQVEHPDKFGKYYRYTDADDEKIMTYLDSLIGIWRFNLSELTATIADESGYGNDGIIYTYDRNYSIELSEKGIQ